MSNRRIKGKLAIQIVCIVFAIEAILMLIFEWFNLPFTGVKLALFDSLLLSLVCSPLIYQIVIRPYVDRITSKEMELASRNDKLSDSEEKLKSVLNTILESVILIDDKGHIEYMNPMAESVFQYNLSEVKGQNVKMLMSQPYQSEHDGYISNYIQTRKAKTIGSTREASGMRKDGSVFPLELGVSEVRLKERVMFAGVLKDITEKKQSDFYLSSIAKIQDMYINGSEQSEIFDALLKFLLEYTGSEYGFIGAIFHDDKQKPYLKTFAITNVAWNEETKTFYDENAPQGLEFRNLDTLFGHTIRTGEVVISNDPANDPRSGGLPDGHPKMRSYLGMPINGNEGLIAMYGMANRREGYSEALAKELHAITTVMTSIIESARSLSLIEKMANRDALTGAYNRFYFKTHVNELLRQRANKRQDDKFCIIMIDFNKFKHINDFHGHEYGDYIIKEFVNRVEENIKTQDLLARIGGDEFVVLADDINDFTDAGKIAKIIVNLSKMPYLYKGKKLKCSASIGIACFPISGNNIDELLRHADLALYRAKTSSEGYCYFSDDLQDSYMIKQCLERDIITAFKNREFYLVLQPKVDITTKKIIGCEALIRWLHPEQGNVPPGNFIGAIESMGLSDRLNLYVIEEIIQVFKGRDVDSALNLSINISPYIHNLKENIYQVVEMLDNSSLSKKVELYFEITETSFMSNEVNFKKGSELDEVLSKQNIGLSIDDFGVEHSSINRLFECNFSKIKIDMSFIQKLDTEESPAAKVVIKAILDIASGLGVDVISEGVETEAQLNELKKLGGKIAQGYYFYKPLPVDEFLELVGERLD